MTETFDLLSARPFENLVRRGGYGFYLFPKKMVMVGGGWKVVEGGRKVVEGGQRWSKVVGRWLEVVEGGRKVVLVP